MKRPFSGQIFEKYSNTKFRDNTWIKVDLLDVTYFIMSK